MGQNFNLQKRQDKLIPDKPKLVALLVLEGINKLSQPNSLPKTYLVLLYRLHNTSLLAIGTLTNLYFLCLPAKLTTQ